MSDQKKNNKYKEKKIKKEDYKCSLTKFINESDEGKVLSPTVKAAFKVWCLYIKKYDAMEKRKLEEWKKLVKQYRNDKVIN
jgi:hypothetical protein